MAARPEEVPKRRPTKALEHDLDHGLGDVSGYTAKRAAPLGRVKRCQRSHERPLKGRVTRPLGGVDASRNC
jgi:hypothetical protein